MHIFPFFPSACPKSSYSCYHHLQINLPVLQRSLCDTKYPISKTLPFQGSTLVINIHNISLTFTDVPYLYIEITIHGSQNSCKPPLPSFHLLLNTHCDKMVQLWKKKETRDFNTPFDPPIRIIKATRSQHIWGE